MPRLALAASVVIFTFFTTIIVQANSVSTPDYRAGELIVGFKNSDIIRVYIDPNQDLNQAITEYKNNPEVSFVEPNYLVEPAVLLPNDPDFSRQHYLALNGAVDAWDFSQGQNVIVAVLDTGVDTDHPDLRENIWVNPREIKGDGIDNDGNGFVDDINGWDFVLENNNPKPKINGEFDTDLDAVHHGTVVSGVLAAAINNNEGIVGVAPKVKILPLRFIDSNGRGDIFDAVRAIDYAKSVGAKVINMSFVGEDFSESMLQKIEEAYASNITIVSAAGNTERIKNGYDLHFNPMYPVCYGRQITDRNILVGAAALDGNFEKSKFSNYGGGCIDVSAPGENIYSTVANEIYIPSDDLYRPNWSGTSMAAPQVSAAAAIIYSIWPQATAQQVADILINSSINIDEDNPDFVGKIGGRLNVFAAALAATNQDAPTPVVTKPIVITPPAFQTPISKAGIQRYIVTAPESKDEPRVRIYNQQGQVVNSFLAYNSNFRGGIDIATGDVDGDGQQEIVTAAGRGGGPHIRVFNHRGELENQFFAYEKFFTGGVRVAVGDIDGQPGKEIVVAPMSGRSAQIKIFKANGQLLNQFTAYVEAFLGGASVAVADVNLDGSSEIITGAGPEGGPHLRVFKASGQPISGFFVFDDYDSDFKGGLNVAVGKTLGGGEYQIVVSGQNETNLLRLYTWNAFEIKEWKSLSPKNYGHNLAVGEFVPNNGAPEIIVGPASLAQPVIEIYNGSGELLQSFDSQPAGFTGGLRVAPISF